MRFTRPVLLILPAILLASLAPLALAQTVETDKRIYTPDSSTRTRTITLTFDTDDKPRTEVSEAEGRRRVELRMRDLIDHVRIEGADARDAFEWWANTTGISLVVNWNRLEAAGIDPQKTINLDLRHVPAGQCLSLLMKATEEEGIPLIYELTPWYVQIMTKEEANRRTVTRLYDISELLHDVPNFTDAPNFRLDEALSSEIGGEGGGVVTPFGAPEREPVNYKTKEQRGQEIAEMIQAVIEPEIWGFTANMRYFQGRLIVTAPLYVHKQIGIPPVRSQQPTLSPSKPYRASAKRSDFKATYHTGRSDVAGIRE